MGKQSGLGALLLISGHDLSGDISSLDKVSGSMAVLDSTGIKSLANERLGGLHDGDLQVTSWFDVGTEHPVLSALPTSDVIAMGAIPLAAASGLAIGDPAFAISGKQLNYDGTRGTDGSFSFKAETVGNGFALEWGELLTPGVRTDTAATHGTALDAGASSSFGVSAYLEFGAFTGTDVTVRVEHSTDNTTFTTLASFTALTAGQSSQRVAAAGTVNRYLRVSTVTTGGFTSAAFTVMVNRNLSASDL